MNYMCPVCGYPHLRKPAYDVPLRKDAPFYDGEPSYGICPSCSFEFGFTDTDQGFTFEQWRQKWINGGMIWREGRGSAPKDWDPRKQVAKVMHITGGRL